jgi:transmembrane sensor
VKPSTEDVAARFAAGLGDGPSRATLAAQRVRVMEMAQRSFRPRARPNVRVLAVALVPIAAAALVLLLFLTREREFAAKFRGIGIEVHAPLATGETSPETLDFSDGSTVVLEPRALATLSELTAKHAGLHLEGGKVSANIHKHPGMTWTVTAGPYAVHVVGTRFSVEWNAGSRAFEVLVREGRVRVTGGDLPPDGVLVGSGGRLERRPPVPAPERAVGSNASERANENPRPAEAGEKAADASPAASGRAAISALAGKGKYREALALAERQGFERLANELPENELLLLANAARYSGDAGRARLALLKLRQRFAGRPAADLAALYLAKIAEDMTHEPREAVRWLRTFLQSSPSGDLAAGARASLMSLLLRSGDDVSARAVAEDYLRYHANGPHADEARALVRE